VDTQTHQPPSYHRKGGFVLTELYGLVFANGDLNPGPAVEKARHVPKSALIVVADGGLRNALTCNRYPDIVIGDMDSIDLADLAEVEQRGVEIQRFSVDKDETDLELALLIAAKRGCDPIRVFGAIGDRLDQTIGNVYLLALPELRDRDTRLVSGKQTVWLAHPGEHVIVGEPGDTVSLLPIGAEITEIVTDRLKYPLRRETLLFGPARGMSNVMLENEARVTFDGGLLLIIHTIGQA
jgi:thiamine pyrophosphokinase